DTKCESNETFTVTLTGATNASVGSPSASAGTIVNDDVSQVIAATAGSGGSISPSGNVTVACGASRQFVITPSDCFAIADVTVDGSSVGAVATYTFTNVTVGHTIDATFASAAFYAITASAGAGGSIAPS